MSFDLPMEEGKESWLFGKRTEHRYTKYLKTQLLAPFLTFLLLKCCCKVFKECFCGVLQSFLFLSRANSETSTAADN